MACLEEQKNGSAKYALISLAEHRLPGADGRSIYSRNSGLPLGTTDLTIVVIPYELGEGIFFRHLVLTRWRNTLKILTPSWNRNRCEKSDQFSYEWWEHSSYKYSIIEHNYFLILILYDLFFIACSKWASSLPWRICSCNYELWIMMVEVLFRFLVQMIINMIIILLSSVRPWAAHFSRREPSAKTS